jgi:hypothetical protein
MADTKHSLPCSCNRMWLKAFEVVPELSPTVRHSSVTQPPQLPVSQSCPSSKVMKSFRHALSEEMRYVQEAELYQIADIYSYVKSWSKQSEIIPMLARSVEEACFCRSSL